MSVPLSIESCIGLEEIKAYRWELNFTTIFILKQLGLKMGKIGSQKKSRSYVICFCFTPLLVVAENHHGSS